MKSHRQTVGVRLPGETRQKVAQKAAILCIPQSSFIRVLITLALEQIEKDPSLLLKRSKKNWFSSEHMK